MTDPLVLVTGASGYVGSWCVAALLHAGYRVRGTVRSAASDKAAFLRALCPTARHAPVELVEADLLLPGGWAAAVAGCAYVLHVASPFTITEVSVVAGWPRRPVAPDSGTGLPTRLMQPTDADALIKPAVDGTLHVLRAVRDAVPRPRRVVVTSSFASVGMGLARPSGHVYTEADHSDARAPALGAYVRSKCLAESAAWDFVASLQPEAAFELATLHPTLVLGPTLGGRVDSGSAEIIGKILRREMPALPRVPLNIVDVRDVALVHLGAMTHPGAAGQRFIASGASITLDQLGPPLAAAFAPLGFRVPTFVVPDVVLRIAAWWDAAAAAAAGQLGKPKPASAAKAEALFGLRFNADFGAGAVALGRGLVAAGQVPDVSPGRVLSEHLPLAERAEFATPHFPPAFDSYALPA